MEKVSADNQVDKQSHEEEETDAYKLSAIFPSEVWEKIYKQLTESRDLLNLSNASSFWEEHLSPSKVCWIFKMVCPILCTYLDKKIVLACREVCQDWKASVDDFLPSWRFLDPLTPSTNGYYVNFPGDNRQNPERMTFKQLSRCDQINGNPWDHPGLLFDQCSRLIKIEDIEHFKSVWDNSTGNPFLSGSIEAIQWDADRYSELHDDFWPEVIAILKQHGQRISRLKVFFEVGDLSLLERIHTLRDMLTEVPNLRELHVDFSSPDPVEFNTIRKWIRILEKRPFPSLPRLQAIYVDPVIYETFTIFSGQLIDVFPGPYFQQVSKLQYPMEYCLEFLMPKPDTFPNLVDIKLDIRSVADLKSLGVLNSPLKRVNLTVQPIGVHVRNVMQVLAKFGSTLTVLEMWVYWNEDKEEIDAYTEQDSLSFPQLKIIKIQFWQDTATEALLNDLLVFSSSLPPFVLEVKCLRDESQELSFFLPHPDDILQVHGYVERMYESAIWELIPSLGRFRFEGQNRLLGKSAWKTYTREEYEKLKGRQLKEADDVGCSK